MKVLRTANDVINVLGTTNAEIARMLGVEYNTITNWRMFGHFPPDTYVMIQRELELRDYIAPPSLWKMRTREKPRRRNNPRRAKA